MKALLLTTISVFIGPDTLVLRKGDVVTVDVENGVGYAKNQYFDIDKSEYALMN